MDSLAAFALGQASRGKEMKVFDWDKAAKIIKEKKPLSADAGLERDYEYTRGNIYLAGKPVKDSYMYLSSTWATPMLILDDDEEIPCYVMQTKTIWNEHTIWPDTALRILEQK